MNIDDLKLYRHRYVFDKSDLPERLVNRIKARITDINTHEAGLRFSLELQDSRPFASFFKSGGIYRNVSHYISCVVDHDFPFAYQRAGYFGQKLLMDIFCMGLEASLVYRFFDEGKVSTRIRRGEKLIFLIAIGKESDIKPSLTARIVRLFASGSKFEKSKLISHDKSEDEYIAVSPHLLKGLKAIAFLSKEIREVPILIRLTEKGYAPRLTASLPKDVSIRRLIDMGRAMFNFEVGAEGFWEWLNPPSFYPYNS